MIFVQIDVTSIFMIFTMYLSSFISIFLTLRLAEISLFHKVSSINYEIADKGGGGSPKDYSNTWGGGVYLWTTFIFLTSKIDPM